MMEKTTQQVWASWAAKQTGDNFQAMLNAQTEDGKYQILANLLREENLRPAPLPKTFPPAAFRVVREA